MTKQDIFNGTKKAYRIDTHMLIEALVFCIYESTPKVRSHFFVLYRRRPSGKN